MPFLLTTIAGLSTMIGTFLIFISKKKSDFIILGSLSFAAAVMMTVSFTDLIPESFHMLSLQIKTFPTLLILLIFLNIGIILSFSIDKYLPDTSSDGLYRVGLISMLAIILHNIPEGIATFMAGNTDIALGITLTIAIALHNIPEGISISVPIYYATGSKRKALFYTFISGLSELLGAIITYLFLKPFISDLVMGCLFAVIAGIMLHIAVYELLPTSLKYQYKKLTIIFFVIGMLFMITSHLLFN